MTQTVSNITDVKEKEKEKKGKKHMRKMTITGMTSMQQEEILGKLRRALDDYDARLLKKTIEVIARNGIEFDADDDIAKQDYEDAKFLYRSLHSDKFVKRELGRVMEKLKGFSEREEKIKKGEDLGPISPSGVPYGADVSGGGGSGGVVKPDDRPKAEKLKELTESRKIYVRRCNNLVKIAKGMGIDKQMLNQAVSAIREDSQRRPSMFVPGAKKEDLQTAVDTFSDLASCPVVNKKVRRKINDISNGCVICEQISICICETLNI
jgi:hypothetical protein